MTLYGANKRPFLLLGALFVEATSFCFAALLFEISLGTDASGCLITSALANVVLGSD